MRRMSKKVVSPEMKERSIREMQNALEFQAERLAHLVSDLLDVSRIAVGRFHIRYMDADLVSVVRRTVETLGQDLEKANCPIEIRAGPSLEGRWDPLRIEQIVANLIGNAMKHAASCKITVTVESADAKARLIVEDQGSGIAQQDQERIFERYERATSIDHVGGLGLGLYITRQIVEAHGGTIRVESEVGKGSKFIVELPVRPVET